MDEPVMMVYTPGGARRKLEICGFLKVVVRAPDGSEHFLRNPDGWVVRIGCMVLPVCAGRPDSRDLHRTGQTSCPRAPMLRRKRRTRGVDVPTRQIWSVATMNFIQSIVTLIITIGDINIF